MRDTMMALHAHLGGEDRVTEPQRLQCRRVAALEAELVYIEDKIAKVRAEGGTPDMRDLDLGGADSGGAGCSCETDG